MSFIDKVKHALGFPSAADDDQDEQDISSTGYGIAPKQEENAHRITREYSAGHAETTPGYHVTEDENRRRQDEVDKLRNSLKAMENDRDECRRLQLSSERQKRALSDRVFDLEQQVINLEHEKDTLFDQNKNLTAKLKIASSGKIPLGNIQPDMVEFERAKERLEELENENRILKNDLETLDVKCKMQEAMVADLSSKASQANRDLKEAHEELENAARAMKDVERFEEFMKKKDLRIAELKRSVLMKEEEIENLRATIEHNLQAHAVAQDNMRREIAALRAASPEASASVKPFDQMRQRGHHRAERTRDDKKKRRDRDDDDKQMSLW